MTKRLALLWGLVAVCAIGAVTGLFWMQQYIQIDERARAQHEARLRNDASAVHSLRVITQADNLVRAVRSYYQATRSIEATRQFIASLEFDDRLYGNLYVIDATGKVVVARAAFEPGHDVSGRIASHPGSASDTAHFGSVEPCRTPGKFNFALTRRIASPGGIYAGVVGIDIRLSAFTDYFMSLGLEQHSIAALISTQDHKIRARYPQPALAAFDRPLESQALWDAFAKAPSGSYRKLSTVDGIDRHVVYQQVDGLPLIMGTGIGSADIAQRVAQRMGKAILIVVFAGLFVLTLAVFLSVTFRQNQVLQRRAAELVERNEDQQRFLSMLSHEIKTPLAVIEMAQGYDSVSGRDAIARSVAEISAVITHCLQNDQLEHGGIELRPESHDIPKLLTEVVVNSRASARVQLDAPPNLPWCTTDAYWLTVIVANLIDNALKYSPPDSEIRVAAEVADREGASGVRIAVTNLPGAAGMPDPAQVFSKFYRAPRARAQTGSGLGLHIAEGLARKLGGELRYCPEAAAVKFTLWIPV